MKNNSKRRGRLINVHWFFLVLLSLLLLFHVIILLSTPSYDFYIWDTECLAPILISVSLILTLILLICKKPPALRLLELSFALMGGFLLFEALSLSGEAVSYDYEILKKLVIFNRYMNGISIILSLAFVLAGHFISGFYRKNFSLLFYGREEERDKDDIKFTELTELFGALAAAFALSLAGLLYDGLFDMSRYRIDFSYFGFLLLPAAVLILLYVLLRLRKEAAMPVLLILSFVLLPFAIFVILKSRSDDFIYHLLWLLGFMALAVYSLIFFRKNAGELFIIRNKAGLAISDESMDYTEYPSLSRVKRADLKAAFRTPPNSSEKTQTK